MMENTSDTLTTWTDASGKAHVVNSEDLKKTLDAIFVLSHLLHNNLELQEYVKRPPYKDPLCVKGWQGGLKRLASQIAE